MYVDVCTHPRLIGWSVLQALHVLAPNYIIVVAKHAGYIQVMCVYVHVFVYMCVLRVLAHMHSNPK